MPRLAIPQYTSQARPQGIVRPANIPGVVDTSGLAQGLANASAIVSHQAARDAAEAERIKAKQEHEARQLEEGEARVAVANAVSEAQSDWTERLAKAQQSATAGAAGFTATTLKDFDAWSEQAIAKVPALGQQALRERLATMRNQIHGRAFQFETDARNAKIGGDFNAGLELDRNTVTADPSQYNSLLANRMSLLQTLGLDAATTAKIGEATRHSMAQSAAEGMVARNPEAFLQRTGMAGGKTRDGQPLPSDPKKAAEAVQNDPVLRNLKPEALTQLVERATMLTVTRQQQAEMAAERRRREGEAHLGRAAAVAQAFQMQADKGTALDPAYVNQAMTATAGTPFQAVIQSTAQQVQAVGGFAAQSIPTQRATLDAIDAEIAKNGRNPAIDKRREQVSRIVESSTTDFAKDPMRAGLERGIIKEIPQIDFQNGMGGIVQSFAARVPLAQRVTQWAGKDAKPLTGDEAAAMSSWLANLNPGEKEQFVGAMNKTLGTTNAMPFLRQLGKDAPTLAIAGGLAGMQTTAGRSVPRLIFEGEALMRDKQVKMPDDARMNAEFQKIIGDSIPTIGAKVATLDAVKAVYAKLLTERGKFNETNIDSGAFETAVRVVAGNPMQYNGATILPPAYGLPHDQAAALLKGVTPAQVKAWGGVAGMTDEQAAAYIRDARLESQTFGKYRVNAGTGILHKPDGTPFEMIFR